MYTLWCVDGHDSGYPNPPMKIGEFSFLETAKQEIKKLEDQELWPEAFEAVVVDSNGEELVWTGKWERWKDNFPEDSYDPEIDSLIGKGPYGNWNEFQREMMNRDIDEDFDGVY